MAGDCNMVLVLVVVLMVVDNARAEVAKILVALWTQGVGFALVGGISASGGIEWGCTCVELSK